MSAYQGATAFQRVSKVIDKEIKVIDNKEMPNLNLIRSDIVFNNVTFNYLSTNEKAINKINIEIKGGTLTAFVGHSGAGKTTIMNLLPRFYEPQTGSIQIDKQDIKSVTLKSLRKNLSLVSQDVVLFDDTVKENISYAKSNSTNQEIEEACRFAAAHDFVKKLPQGYDTKIGENGVRLSGGQKQRISIARAILKQSPIILLDEATSSLDTESEEVVQKAIANLTKNKTTLVIAHRLSTIHNADKIFVMKNGEIVNSGNHTFLIDNCEEYKSLYKKQLR
jgi:subfamily B ATP-binding cassette protein MsbA